MLKDKKPIFAVECKSGDRALSPHIAYFKARTKIPKFFQVHLGDTRIADGRRMASWFPSSDFVRRLVSPKSLEFDLNGI